MILAGRRINDRMGKYISTEISKELRKRNIDEKDAECLILGLTFKENCPDVRNTKVLDIYNDMIGKFKKVDISDSRALEDSIIKVFNKKSVKFDKNNLKKYDVVVLAVNHTEYSTLHEGEWILPEQVIFDVKSVINFEKVLSL